MEGKSFPTRNLVMIVSDRLMWEPLQCPSSVQAKRAGLIDKYMSDVSASLKCKTQHRNPHAAA